MSQEHRDDERLPLEVTRQIDSLCDEFEKQLTSEDALDLGSIAGRVDPIARKTLLIELIGLALGWLRDAGCSSPSDQLLAANPEMQDEIASLLSEVEATVAHTPSGIAGAGLHVRCPHCHNPIELLPDAALESIRCQSCGSDFSLVEDEQPTRAAEAMTQIAHFKLVDRVGMGAFGSVFKAHDTKLDRTVAVKIPRKGQFDDKQERAFIREAQNAAQLNHPNIVPVYEVGRDGDTLYIVSGFIRGLTLADWLTGQQPTLREAAELVVILANTLQHAHDRGVIHRDLKPGNIMLDDEGRPHLMDFGLAKREATEITMSLDGRVFGTPAYIPPEQAVGEGSEADARSDVYALGVILFQLLTGELPFRGNSSMLIHQAIHSSPPSPRKLNPNVPVDLETITLKCLEKPPGRRYQTARNLGEELQAWLEGRPISARPIGPVRRAWRQVAPHLHAVAGALWMAQGLVAALTLAGFFLNAVGEEIAAENGTLSAVIFLGALCLGMTVPFIGGAFTIAKSSIATGLGLAWHVFFLCLLVGLVVEDFIDNEDYSGVEVWAFFGVGLVICIPGLLMFSRLKLAPLHGADAEEFRSKKRIAYEFVSSIAAGLIALVGVLGLAVTWPTDEEVSSKTFEYPVARISLDDEVEFDLLATLSEEPDRCRYRALHIPTGREVMLTKADGSGASTVDDRHAFVENAILQSNLRHRGIPPVFDIAEDDDGIPYYVTPMPGSPWKPSECNSTVNLWALDQVSRVVAYAHSRDTIHLRVSPENVRYRSLYEFRLVAWDHAIELKSTNSPPTPGLVSDSKYIAPELDGSTDTDPTLRVDVYALGAILREILAIESRSTSRLPDDLRAELMSLAERALYRDPAQRPASAVDFLSALREIDALSRLSAKPNPKQQKNLTDDQSDSLPDQP